MKIVEVRPHDGNSVFTRCCRCDSRIDGRSEKVFADLDGEPFFAYYCAACVAGTLTPVKGEVSK